jgi:hypothetical protein
MLRISEAIDHQVRSNENIFEALRLGVLNLSAYAGLIRPRIEQDCMKPVRPGSIVVALSRLAKKIQIESSLRPLVKLDDISMKSPLCDISFERTEAVLLASKKLQQEFLRGSNDFFTLTEGLHEVTIICAQNQKETVLTLMQESPKAVIEDLTGISMRFDANYVGVPNAIYSLLGTLAPSKINVLEIVSTYAEITILVRTEDAVKALKKLS